MFKLLLLFPLLMGCAGSLPVVRSDYQLMRVNDFLITNSYVNPSELEKRKEGPFFKYQLMVKNLKDTSREINLSESFVMIGLRKISLNCRSLSNKETSFTVGPGETFSVLCETHLNNAEGMFQVSDYKALVDIPLEGQSVQYAYLFRVEDFQ